MQRYFGRRDNGRKCFTVPNWIFERKLDAVAIAAYIYLRFNEHRRWDAPLVDVKKLSDALQVSESVMEKRIKVLLAQSLIDIEHGYIVLLTKRIMRPPRFGKVENVKHSFLLPNELFTLNLCAGEIAVYAFLRCCENRDTYQCYPSYKTIGEAISMSRGTVKKYVDSLVEKHLIYTEPTSVWGKGGKKRNGNLLYTIRPIADAVAFCVESGFGNLTKMTLLEANLPDRFSSGLKGN